MVTSASQTEARLTHLFASRGLLAAASVGAGVAAGLVSATSPRAAVALGILMLAALVVWVLRRHALVVLMVVLWYLPPQTEPGGLLDSYIFLRWIGVALIPVVAGVLLAHTLVTRRELILTRLGLPIAAMLVAILLSGIANHAGVFNTLTVGIFYLRYPLLFLALINLPISLRTTREIVTVFMVLVFLQIPEVMVRYAFLGAYGDNISWSLGPSGTFPLGVYCTYALCLVAGAIATRGFSAKRLAMLAALLIPSVIGEIKALLFLSPVAVAAVLAMPGRRLIPLARRVVPLAALGGIAVALYEYWAASSDKAVAIAMQTQIVQTVSTGLPRVDRVAWTIDAVRLLQTGRALAFGIGPGSSFHERFAESGLAGTTQVVTMLLDVGVLGLACYAVLLAATLTIIVKATREARGELLAYACAMVGMWVFYALLGPNYDNMWKYDGSSFLFWVLLASLYVGGHAIHAEKEAR